MQNAECGACPRGRSRAGRRGDTEPSPFAGADSCRASGTRWGRCLAERGRQAELERRDRSRRHKSGHEGERRAPRGNDAPLPHLPRRDCRHDAAEPLCQPRPAGRHLRHVRPRAGRGWATRSAHSAVVTATTARTCRVARIMPGRRPHVDAVGKARQADDSLYVGRPPRVLPGILGPSARVWPSFMAAADNLTGGCFTQRTSAPLDASTHPPRSASANVTIFVVCPRSWRWPISRAT
jgi:hypothetical protein